MSDDDLASAFDQQLKNVMDTIAAAGTGRESLKAMSSLYELCFQQWGVVMGEDPIVQIAVEIWQNYASIQRKLIEDQDLSP